MGFRGPNAIGDGDENKKVVARMGLDELWDDFGK